MIVEVNAGTKLYNALSVQVRINSKTIDVESMVVSWKWVKFALMSHLNVEIVEESIKPSHLDVWLDSKPKLKLRKKMSKNLKLKKKSQPPL